MNIIALIGIGMGNPKNVTMEGIAYIKNSDLIIGSNRLLEPFRIMIKSEANIISAESAKEIICLIQDHIVGDNINIAVLLSGDCGFFSESEKIVDIFAQDPDYEVKCISGISSLSYFSNRINVPYHDTVNINLKGQEEKIISYIMNNKRVFCVNGGDVEKLLGELIKARAINQLSENVRIYIGERLSYDDEKIIVSSLKDIHRYKNEISKMSSLSVFLFENDDAKCSEIS